MRPLRPEPAVADSRSTREIVPLAPAAIEPQPEPAVPEPLPPNNALAVLRPAPQPAAPSEPVQPEPQTAAAEIESAASPIPVSDVDLPRGRALLRILERGYGPSIEIAWPPRQRDRGELFALFSRCFGLRVALMTDDGALYGLDGAPGEALDLDIDYYSGFVRSPEGRLTSEEHRQIAAMHATHGQLANASAIRIFPRRVDALLLGGLRAVIGESYQNTSTIHAAYLIRGSSVAVTAIVADGRSFPGEIDLLRARQRCA